MSSKKKGLSMEEKIERVEKWFADHPHPHLLKELTAAIPKATGVIPQSIEEVLELLISENRIACDRLGTSNLYWKFAPGEDDTSGGKVSGGADASSNKKSFEVIAQGLSSDELTERIIELEDAIRTIQQQTEERHAALETTEETIANEQLSVSLKASIAVLLDKCAAFADRDPLVAEQLLASARIALDAANRWTDNVCLMEQFVTRRMSHLGLTSKDFRTQFGIPEDFDSLDIL